LKEFGWIKLYRELLEKPIWKTSTVEQKVILITLLLMASHKENKWEWQNRPFLVKSGQFVTSLESIASQAGRGVSVQNVRTSIKRFEAFQFLTNESTKSGRLITILNWDSYQAQEIKSTDELTVDQQTPNKGLTPIKNVKNVITKTYVEEAQKILKKINSLAGTKFRDTKAIITLLKYEKGIFKPEDLIKVVEFKYQDKFIRENHFTPASLFRKTAFSGKLDAAHQENIDQEVSLNEKYKEIYESNSPPGD